MSVSGMLLKKVAFINSIKIKNCLYYGSAQFIKDGHKNINAVNVSKALLH